MLKTLRWYRFTNSSPAARSPSRNLRTSLRSRSSSAAGALSTVQTRVTKVGKQKVGEFRRPKVHADGPGCNSRSRLLTRKARRSVIPCRLEGAIRQGFLITVGVDPAGVEEVNAAFAGFAESHSLPAPVRRSVNVALDELLANALSHGGTGRDPCSLTVEVKLDEERVTVILTDDGTPFDPFEREAPDTTLSVEDRPIGGLGLHLVGQLMDQVSYQRREGHNVVVLVKQLVNR